MKKRTWIIILAAVLLLAILFVPIPKGPYKDGGTREYSALTYKVVHWNRLTAEGVHEATRLYLFPHNFQSVDRLWEKEEQNVVYKFTAAVLEIYDGSVLVQPLAGEDELRSSDRFSVNIAGLDDLDVQAGSYVVIYYNGMIEESYPARISAVRWEIANDLRGIEYTGPWLDKETAEKRSDELFSDIIITRIYRDCFFAVPVIPMPYEIKLNGQLSQVWCVGDQVICTYENAYYDADNHKAEADFLTVNQSDFQLDPNACYKPVIYLYPEEETQVSVQLSLDGKLTCTYPAYQGGWNVTASPDGTLRDAHGQTYNYLYWEGETGARWDMTKGFCVKGADTAAFLEEALEKLGLTRREANEFIVYWLPLMEQNPYNILSFQTDRYTDAAELHIEPVPDTLIRVFMTWQASEHYVNLTPQELSAPERTGFTAVEWGGCEIQ